MAWRAQLPEAWAEAREALGTGSSYARPVPTLADIRAILRREGFDPPVADLVDACHASDLLLADQNPHPGGPGAR
jgi:hypothetical protein